MIRVVVRVTNVYPAGTVVVTETVLVPAAGDDVDGWADSWLYPLTGTGEFEGDAGYFVEILEADDARLVGCEFEFGV